MWKQWLNIWFEAKMRIKYDVKQEHNIIHKICKESSTKHMILNVIVYTEYQSVCPFVGIGSPHPSTTSECVSPHEPMED